MPVAKGGRKQDRGNRLRAQADQTDRQPLAPLQAAHFGDASDQEHEKEQRDEPVLDEDDLRRCQVTDQLGTEIGVRAGTPEPEPLHQREVAGQVGGDRLGWWTNRRLRRRRLGLAPVSRVQRLRPGTGLRLRCRDGHRCYSFGRRGSCRTRDRARRGPSFIPTLRSAPEWACAVTGSCAVRRSRALPPIRESHPCPEDRPLTYQIVDRELRNELLAMVADEQRRPQRMELS